MASALELTILRTTDAVGVVDYNAHLNAVMGGSGDPFMFHLGVKNLAQAGLITVAVLANGKTKISRV
jgi:hypothetical protein